MTAHFIQRARERGPQGIDAETLRDEVRRAVRERREDFAERVKATGDGQSIYRLKLGEHGIFYAIVSDVTGAPITFYTQAQFRMKRYGLKCRRRNLPPPGRHKVRNGA